MADYHSTIDSTVNGLDKLRNAIKKEKSAQIRSSEQKAVMKATALAWFNKQRSILLNAVDESVLKATDEYFKNLLLLSDKACARSKADDLLKNIKKKLTELRAENITTLSS